MFELALTSGVPERTRCNPPVVVLNRGRGVVPRVVSLPDSSVTLCVL
jgi:hypothetical protein